MTDTEKTREQLLRELVEARRQIKFLTGGKDEPGQVETVLPQTEDKFYKAFLASPDMIIISSIPDGIYIEANESFARNVGYSRQELIGHKLEEFDFFASPAEQVRMMQIMEKQGYYHGEEFTFRVRSGQIQQWLCSAEVIKIAGEDRMVATAVDITERKKMEQQLTETEQILAAAFHASPQAIAITTLKEGRFIEVNESHVRLTGNTREELIGHTALELNHWQNPADRDRVLQNLMTTGHSNEVLSFRNKSGEMRTVLFSAQLIKIKGETCIIGSSTDLTERGKMEKALRESEEKFSRAFTSSPTAIALFSIEDSRFMELNESFTRFTGYSREEALGHTPDDLNLWVNPEEMDNMATALKVTGKLVNEKVHSRMKTGEVRTGLFSAQTFTMNDKAHMILSVNDITEQVKAEEAIANEAILKRILIHNSKDGIVILDSTGKVFEANRRYCEMLGYTPEEMKNLHVWDWDVQWDRENLLGQIRNVNETGDHFDTYQKCKDGSVIDVEISTNGAIVAGEKLVFCVCRDITQRKQMEKALRESEEKFSKAFHASPEITAITTLEGGRFVDVNENWINFSGFTREEIIGRSTESLGIWASSADREDMFKTLKEQGRVIRKEYKFRRKSGEIRTLLFSGEKITISGEPCLLGASIDVTEQKLIEAKAMEAENLREIDKLRRELLANVSHELRTPLAGIKGFTTMLIDYNKRLKPTEKQEYLRTIDKNADRLVELIEQLLEMSRLGAGMLSIIKKPTDVISMCRTVIKEARSRATEHRFSLSLPVKLPQIEIDERRIRQVLEHLIDNSVKYSKPGTEITLSVRKKPDCLLFTVADHGTGVPKEDIPHIFDGMFSVKPYHQPEITGAGLGLSMCKGLIDAHNGKIWFESEEGAGSKCSFTLPLKPSAAENNDSARSRAILS